ncbi:DNA primase DnaG [uncultured archaeon]|nr:DNA primase DnaG [uncultured archaeon]
MVETSILGASLEVVDRIGPCDGRINVEKIEDSRNVKRRTLLDRAKALLKSLSTDEIPDSKELTELVRETARAAEIMEYGDEKLPAGPGIKTSNEIIVVEGRADVINLLKNDIANVVAIGGANVGKAISDLCRQKEVTVFLDGDRGGDIILKQLMHNTEIDYVARAPPGKEVEELSRKEMIKCLRRRVPVEQAEDWEKTGERMQQQDRREQRFPSNNENSGYMSNRSERSESPQPRYIPNPTPVAQPVENNQNSSSVELDSGVQLKISEHLKSLANSLKARILFGDDLERQDEIPIREVIRSLGDAQQPKAVVLDGIVTQRLLDLAEQKGVKIVAGLKAGTITRKPPSIRVIVKEESA